MADRVHAPHPHIPRNVNQLHDAEQAVAGINMHIAVALTKGVGTMWTAYAFTVLAIIGLFGILGGLSPIVVLLVAWTSQTFLQLVFLPILAVGQNVLGRKAEIEADEEYERVKKIYADAETIISQNGEIIAELHDMISQWRKEHE